jgi:hypothetical protein
MLGAAMARACSSVVGKAHAIFATDRRKHECLDHRLTQSQLAFAIAAPTLAARGLTFAQPDRHWRARCAACVPEWLQNCGLRSRRFRHAIPLHGTYVGFPSDHLGMEVQVSVTFDSARGYLDRSATDRTSTIGPMDRRRERDREPGSHGIGKIEHRGRWKNNRAENSHQPTRRRERKMQRFKSAGSTQQSTV